MRIKGEYTVVLVKPDGVRKGIVGEVTTRFERVGLKIAAMKMVWVDADLVGKHYKDDNEYHKSVGIKALENYKNYGLDAKESLGTNKPVEIGKIIRKWNVEFITSGPVIAMILVGPGAVKLVRKMVGNTFPSDSQPGTIRGDFALDSSFQSNLERRTTYNIIHASGVPDEAEFERKLWFKEKEIFEY